MFGLGSSEVLIILVLALILLGPRRLPDVARQLGKGLREVRNFANDVERQIQAEVDAVAEPPRPPAPTSPAPDVPAPEASEASAPPSFVVNPALGEPPPAPRPPEER